MAVEELQCPSLAHQLNLMTGTIEAFSQSRPVLALGEAAKLNLEIQKCSARRKLRFPLQLFSAPPSRDRPRPSIIIIAPPICIRRFITWSPTPFAAAVRRLVSHFAVTFARGLAPAHHQIPGDEHSITFRRSSCRAHVCARQQNRRPMSRRPMSRRPMSRRPMSHMGQSRPKSDVRVTSALLLIATEQRTSHEVSSGSRSDISSVAIMGRRMSLIVNSPTGSTVAALSTASKLKTPPSH